MAPAHPVQVTTLQLVQLPCICLRLIQQISHIVGGQQVMRQPGHHRQFSPTLRSAAGWHHRRRIPVQDATDIAQHRQSAEPLRQAGKTVHYSESL